MPFQVGKKMDKTDQKMRQKQVANFIKSFIGVPKLLYYFAAKGNWFIFSLSLLFIFTPIKKCCDAG
jgi:hypothetical protein